MGDTGDELPHRRELLALDELRLERLLVGHIFDQHDNALLEAGAGDARGIQPHRPLQPLRADHQRRGAVAAARGREQIDQCVRFAEQCVAERGADQLGQRHPQQARQRAVRAAHQPLRVHHRNPLAQGVERRLPLLFGPPHHLEEACVGDDHCRMGGQGRQQPNVFGCEQAFARISDDERADHGAVGAQRHGGSGSSLYFADNARGLRTGIAHQLEVLAPRRPCHQPGVVARNRAAAQRRERAFRGGDVQRIGWRLTQQRE